jgi:spore coat protein U-like protein
MRKVLIATLSSATLLAAAGTASAAIATSTFTVSANVLKNCLVSSANLAFGDYTPNTGAKTGSSSITVRCTKTTPYAVSLNAGTTTGGTLGQRLLANGANTLEYNLYTTAGLTTIFGDGTGGTATISGTGNGVSAPSAQTVTVHGQLPDSTANQDATPGSYADTITVTVTY